MPSAEQEKILALWKQLYNHICDQDIDWDLPTWKFDQEIDYKYKGERLADELGHLLHKEFEEE